jgi:hypothetical protein
MRSFSTLSVAMGWDGEAFPDSRTVDRVLALAEPRQYRERWPGEAIDALRMLAKREFVLDIPGTMRDRLFKAAVALAALRGKLRGLPRSLRTETLLAEAKRLEKESLLLAQQINVHPSGGPRAIRIAASRARLAAKLAFDLLNDYGNVPTLTRDGQYLNLTALLIKLATGRPIGDYAVERACRWYVAQLRADGFWTAAEMREMRRAPSRATRTGPPSPEWLVIEARNSRKKEDVLRLIDAPT